MAELKKDLGHLKEDIESFHDSVEHLQSYSDVCTKLVKEFNVREATELFSHLENIDKLIHEVDDHLGHIDGHIENSNVPCTQREKVLDVEDIKVDAKHTLIDLKDIHERVEHLMYHTNACKEIIDPAAEEDLNTIQSHIKDIDNKAHELLDHLRHVRGDLSMRFPEFIWPILPGFEEFLDACEYIDLADIAVHEISRKIVDGSQTIQEATASVLCYVLHSIKPSALVDGGPTTSTVTLTEEKGCDTSRAMLICTLLRSVGIPSRVRFASVAVKELAKEFRIEIRSAGSDFTTAWCEVGLDGQWQSAYDTYVSFKDIKALKDRLIDRGIILKYEGEGVLILRKIPEFLLTDKGEYKDPSEFIDEGGFVPAPDELQAKLFEGTVDMSL